MNQQPVKSLPSRQPPNQQFPGMPRRKCESSRRFAPMKENGSSYLSIRSTIDMCGISEMGIIFSNGGMAKRGAENWLA